MCGYKCELCKAFAPNIEKSDEREKLSSVWKKYYDLNITAEEIYCDGCRCSMENAKRIDNNCPVRRCVVGRHIKHCGECSDFSCATFKERQGISLQEAKEKLGNDFCEDEYNEFLLAYDNLNRITKYKKSK